MIVRYKKIKMSRKLKIQKVLAAQKSFKPKILKVIIKNWNYNKAMRAKKYKESKKIN